MLFNSYSFLLFLAIVLVVYYLLPLWRVRKGFLLTASYVFYAAWNPPFVILLWISTVADWFFARAIHRTGGSRARKTFLVGSLAVNLGLLGFFKYGDFVLENFVALIRAFGIAYAPAEMNIILPVGISFYTFQTLSYTLDVYKGHAKPWHSFLDYALFVTFFPQLVAGPIVRAVDFLPQCEKPKRPEASALGWGFALIVVGLFNKMVVADALMAPIVERIFDSAQVAPLGFLQAWTGAFAFSVQIFGDFAGYSATAIGCALCLGFRIQRNFHFPYAAVGFSDFWSRWHMSLSTWLRDYLYIPLGGNRKGTTRTYINLMITMLLGGLWHGASWLFVIWGALHGILLVTERVLRSTQAVTWQWWKIRWVQFAVGLATFTTVTFVWVPFRAPSLQRALDMGKAMVSFNVHAGMLTKHQFLTGGIVALAIFCLHWALRSTILEQVVERIPWWVTSLVLVAMLYAISASFSGEDRAFIYFQF